MPTNTLSLKSTRMKSYIYLLFFVVICSSCSSNNLSSETESPESNFSIVGQIKGAANQTVKIEAQTERGAISVAETKTDALGNYTLEGNIPGMGIFSMIVGSDARNAIAITLEEDDHAKINGEFNTFSVQPFISGTKWAKPLMTYMRMFNEFAQIQMVEMPKVKEMDAQIELYKKLKLPLDNFVRKQVNSDPGNPVNIVLTSSLFPSPEMGLIHWDPANLNPLKKMDAAFQKNYADSPFSSALSEQVSKIESEYNNLLHYSSGTLAATEIAMNNPKGKELRLSSLKGKIVLIDFWASWCGPCRAENPNVVKLYKKYKSQGFEIFSVSLDKDENAWKAAIEKDGLIWPNHVSDLMQWQSPVVQQYGIQGIPHTVLLNRKGNIIGVGLRGEQLEQKLVEELSKK